MRIVLTDTEWMELIDGERDGLPRCCANISTLRDAIIAVARNGGEVSAFDKLQLIRGISWLLDGHDMTPGVRKLMDQLELTSQERYDLATRKQKLDVE